MSGRVGVPVRVRRVSSELRELRLRSGLGAEEVAGALGMSMSKLSRMESGQRGLQADDVSALLGLYRVPARRREELLSLVRNAAMPNWWRVQEGRLPAMWEETTRFEREASAIFNYETTLVPGMLQTTGYASALVGGTDPDLNIAEIETLVTSRLSRQTVLNRANAPYFEALIEQSTLERLVGDAGVMYQQIRHLVSAARQDNITVRVVETRAGAHPGLDGPFVLFDFDQHPSLVLLENRGSSAFLEEPEHVAATREALRRLHEAALPTHDSIALMNDIADKLV
ncbi:XRE family transcriptional regulator [Saccharopolyspora terrae]|uniref:XRE family transcriptional regulator n=1 Tax=Saccharopolyspora terrae TaxID=2530384 RepID=A0A4R4VC24_9PSEU|nr:helix-turn-helix transcriptional regulator [Saccharopolyspora terrae]TDC99464.1 XRE family transcriptional regulator [Saccharopolyspora terrae]